MLEGFEDAGPFQDFVDIFCGAGDEEVAVLAAQGFGQILESHDAGGIEVAGIFQSEDDDFDVRVQSGALDLGAEDFGGSKEEIALDVDDGDGGDVPGVGIFFFTKFTHFVEFVFGEVGFAGFAEKEGD